MNKSFFLILLITCSFIVSAQNEKAGGQVGQGPSVRGGGLVADPSFEAGTPNAFWNEFSSNFGTPICDAGGCGVGGGTGANTGTFWTWFGGLTGAVEEGSVSQSITIPPAGTVTLSFAFESASCDGTGFMEVLINSSDQVFFIDQTDPSCGVLGYQTINVDLTAYQGQTVDLEFHSITQGDANVNFFIDDIDVIAAGSPPQPSIPVPTLGIFGLLALLLLVVFMSRKKLRQ
ncbi:hypothetical protein ACFODZ_09670 [Marinicella sediminis]|uniref:PEP-CTERM sorting domain-containing protein n=1 Tax=Marinicella sediminis TaxID=1792834 RepID=A0ABV7J8R1_9GAMM|nr:hypothetical protein [Marinicella sediminis]